MEIRYLTCVLMVVLGISSLTLVSSASLCASQCPFTDSRKCAKFCGRQAGKREPTLLDDIGWMDDNEGLANEGFESMHEPSLVEEHLSKLRPELQRIVLELILELEISQMEG